MVREAVSKLPSAWPFLPVTLNLLPFTNELCGLFRTALPSVGGGDLIELLRLTLVRRLENIGKPGLFIPLVELGVAGTSTGLSVTTPSPSISSNVVGDFMPRVLEGTSSSIAGLFIPLVLDGVESISFKSTTEFPAELTAEGV